MAVTYATLTTASAIDLDGTNMALVGGVAVIGLVALVLAALIAAVALIAFGLLITDPAFPAKRIHVPQYLLLALVLLLALDGADVTRIRCIHAAEITRACDGYAHLRVLARAEVGATSRKT